MKRFVALLVLLVAVFGQVMGQNEKLPTLNAVTRKALVDSVQYALNRYYVFPEQARKMADYLQQQLQRKQYDSLVNPVDFCQRLMTDLRTVYNDKHLVIRFDPALQKRILSFTATRKPDGADFDRERRQNFFFKRVEILPANIGYIEFTNFSDTSAAARETVRAAMQFVAHTDALILDLRNNYGGNGTMAGEIAGYFFKDSLYAGRSYNRIDDQWRELWLENKQAITKGLVLSMPVYVLTSKRTFSAAEGLAYTLQQQRKAVVVGDTTRGGAHLTRSFSLGNGFVGFIPFSRSENVVTKTDWEGVGVAPSNKAREENSLVVAQKAILGVKLAAVVDDNEKRKLQWQLNYLLSKEATLQFIHADMAKFTGQFEEFTFSVEGTQLTCTNLHNNNKVNKLLPISSTLFQLNEEAQVNFVINKEGVCDAINLYWNDGWIDTIRRTR